MFLLQRKPLTGLLFVATITLMEIEFDPEKSAKNARERGLPFELAAELEWDKAYAFADDRRDYGEERIVALAPMESPALRRLLSDSGEARRIISFRKANEREERAYEQATADR